MRCKHALVPPMGPFQRQPDGPPKCDLRADYASPEFVETEQGAPAKRRDLALCPHFGEYGFMFCDCKRFERR